MFGFWFTLIVCSSTQAEGNHSMETILLNPLKTCQLSLLLFLLSIFPSEVWWWRRSASQDSSRWTISTSVLQGLEPELCRPDLHTARFQKVKNHQLNLIYLLCQQQQHKCYQSRSAECWKPFWISTPTWRHLLTSFSVTSSDFMKEWLN